MSCNRTICICTSSVPRAAQRPSPASSPSSSARRTPAPTSPYTPRRKPLPPTTVCCCSSRSTAARARAVPCARARPARSGHPGHARGRVRQPRRGRCAAGNARHARPAGLSRGRGGGGHRAALDQHRHRRRTSGRIRPRQDRGVLRAARAQARRGRAAGITVPGNKPYCDYNGLPLKPTGRSALASAAACARTTAPPERSRRTRRKRSTSASASPVCVASRSARRRRAVCRCRCGWLPPRR